MSIRRKLLACLLLTSCGSDATPPDLGTVAADLAGAPPADLAQAPDLADDGSGAVVSDAHAAVVIGSYATRMKTTAIQMLPIIGKQTSSTISLALVEIARDGQGLKVTERGCRARIEGGSMLAMTTIPDAIPRSVPAGDSPFRLWERNGQLLWRRPENVIPVGVKLANPATDVLPTMASDPRVWDQDKDGQPGVTVKVSGFASGDIYVVQRQRSHQSGQVTGTTIAGHVVDASDQSVIGASNPTLNQNIMSTPDPDPAKNTVEFVKLTSAYDCDRLVADEKTLFK